MKKFTGVYTALITPFTNDDQLDVEGVQLLIHRQLSAEIEGIVILGSTGEAPTLSEKEQQQIIKIAKEKCQEKTTLIVGTGSYSTKKTIENTIAAEKAGADAALIVLPYYNKPTQEGLYQHFKAITEATNFPLIIYNVQSRCGVNLETNTLKKLLDFSSIVGIKEASGNISQINDVIALTKKMRPEFSVLSGDDALTLPLMALGGDGVISVISNLLPNEVKNLVKAMSCGNLELAKEIHFSLMPFINLAFIETNPIPIKTLHQMYNLPAGNCRLPLCPLSKDHTLQIQSQFQSGRYLEGI